MIDQLNDYLDSLQEREKTEFKPYAYYNEDGDCFEFLVKDVPFYRERVDSLVTVLRCTETKEIIGSIIKGIQAKVAKILEEHPGFAIEIHDGKVSLYHFFSMQQFSTKDKEAAQVYKTLRTMAEKHEDANLNLHVSL